MMDQVASLMGKKDHFLQLDCRSFLYEYIPSALEGYQYLLCNSKVKHSLAESQYNLRREECEIGVSALRRKYPNVKSLRDADSKMLDNVKVEISLTVFQRCLFVIEENNRVLEASTALKSRQAEHLGKLLYESHKGLSQQFEVSCPELDFLISMAQRNEAIVGGRMMGGGFGGCTINLVKQSAISNVMQQFKKDYNDEYGITLECYKVSLEDGTHLIN